MAAKRPTNVRQASFKSCKAWALVDPDSRQIEPRFITDTRMGNGGRGSITEGWKSIRVEIRAAR